MDAEDTTGRVDFDDGTLTFDTEIQIAYKAPGTEVVFEKFFLVTELNGKEIERKDITDDVKSSEEYEKGIATFALSASYEVVEGDDLRTYVVAEDSLGYIHKDLARYWKQSKGAVAEAVYGGESIYDRQGNMVSGF